MSSQRELVTLLLSVRAVLPRRSLLGTLATRILVFVCRARVVALPTYLHASEREGSFREEADDGLRVHRVLLTGGVGHLTGP